MYQSSIVFTAAVKYHFCHHKKSIVCRYGVKRFFVRQSKQPRILFWDLSRSYAHRFSKTLVHASIRCYIVFWNIKFDDSTAIRSWVTSSDISHRIPLTGEGRSLWGKISGGRGRPLPICWYQSKGNWLRYNFAADSFYIMILCSRLFDLYCRSRPKDDKSRHFDPHFEEVRGGVEPCWIARWKARAEFLLSVIELLFYHHHRHHHQRLFIVRLLQLDHRCITSQKLIKADKSQQILKAVLK